MQGVVNKLRPHAASPSASFCVYTPMVSHAAIIKFTRARHAPTMANASVPDNFVHPSLDKPSEQIRLLRVVQLDADGAEEHIQCELQTFDTGECPAYIAISYTWGDPRSTKPISLNSKTFTVRQNCWYVLWQARRHDLSGYMYLWIDSICINQNDDYEKSLQVAMMGSVYRNAVSVRLCIGPHENDSELLFRARKDYQKFKGSKPPDTSSWTEDELKWWRDRPLKADFFEQMSRPHLEVLVSAMRSLSERTYFKRLWIVQEVYMATATIMWCGNASVGFSSFCQFANKLRAYLVYKEDAAKGLRHPQKFMPIFRHWSMHFEYLVAGVGDLEMDILSLMYQHSDFHCQDPRDHMYGLLSLMNSTDGSPILPDYSKEAWSLLHVLCSRLCILYQAASLRRLSVSERSSLTQPINAFLLAITAMGINREHPEVRKLIEVRKTESLADGTPPISCQRERELLKVPASGYARLYADEKNNNNLSACFTSNVSGDDIGYKSSMERYRDRTWGQSAAHVWNFAKDQDTVPCQPVKNKNGVFALVPRSAKPGDILMSFRDQEVMNGLVLRETQTDEHPLEIIGQALIEFSHLPCSGGAECRCGDNAKYHGAVGHRIIVHLDWDDFIALACHDVAYGPHGFICTNAEMGIERLVTSVTRPDRPLSSFAAWNRGPWPNSKVLWRTAIERRRSIPKNLDKLAYLANQ